MASAGCYEAPAPRNSSAPVFVFGKKKHGTGLIFFLFGWLCSGGKIWKTRKNRKHGDCVFSKNEEDWENMENLLFKLCLPQDDLMLRLAGCVKGRPQGLILYNRQKKQKDPPFFGSFIGDSTIIISTHYDSRPKENDMINHLKKMWWVHSNHHRLYSTHKHPLDLPHSTPPPTSPARSEKKSPTPGHAPGGSTSARLRARSVHAVHLVDRIYPESSPRRGVHLGLIAKTC